MHLQKLDCYVVVEQLTLVYETEGVIVQDLLVHRVD